MTKEETKEAIKVMQAFVDGKEIECKRDGDTVWEGGMIYPGWHWDTRNYRIKPEPKYRPYKSAEEVLEAIKEHGGYIKEGNTYRFLKKFTIQENGDIVYSFSGWGSTTVRTWEYLHDKIVWANGTPFGKLEE